MSEPADGADLGDRSSHGTKTTQKDAAALKRLGTGTFDILLDP